MVITHSTLRPRHESDLQASGMTGKDDVMLQRTGGHEGRDVMKGER